MKTELKKALYLLENIGYTVKPMNESEQNDLVDEIKAKCDEWEELRDTPEGDDLWDEMVDTYGQDLVGLVADEYDAIKKGRRPSSPASAAPLRATMHPQTRPARGSSSRSGSMPRVAGCGPGRTTRPGQSPAPARH